MDRPGPNLDSLSVPGAELFSRHQYRYHALPNHNYIRILKLEPLEPERLNTPLQCSLFNANVDHLWTYIAISYTWGPPEPAKYLYIDDCFLPITPNLRAALLRLRSYWKGGPCYLWVDAVCINQADPEERAQQVQHMKKIYQSAKMTFSWLGEEPMTKIFLALIYLIHQKICPLSECRNGEPLPPARIAFEDVETMSRLGFPPPDDPLWFTLRTLGSTPYFSRVWILQETVCGVENSWLFCGDKKISWHVLETTVRWIGGQDWPTRISARKFARSNSLKGDCWAMLTAHIDVRLITLYKESKTGIELLLSAARRFHATDPRDKIIGVLGLAEDVGPGKRFNVIPSYKKPVADFYRDVTASLIQQGHSLYLLGEIEDPVFRQVPGLPSWVPDYSVTTYRPPVRHGEAYRRCFHASGDSRVAVRWTEGSNQIHIGGHEVDRVTMADRCLSKDLPDCRDVFLRWFGVKAVMSPGSQGLLNMSRPKQWFASLLRPLADNSDWYAERFWRTLIGNNMDGVDVNEVRKRFRTYLFRNIVDAAAGRNGHQLPSEMASLMVRQFAQDLTTVIEEYVHEGNEYVESNDEEVEAFQRTWVRFCNNSALFGTYEQRLGIGPGSMALGDVVCVLRGSPMLHILRPRGEVYRYIGEAYVYDLMNGEALLENEKQMSEFCLE